MQTLATDDPLKAYKDILNQFSNVSQRHNHNFEIQDLVLQLAFRSRGLSDLRDFLDLVSESEPHTLGKGFRKAERAYVRTGDRITKPSYIRRLRSFPDFSRRTDAVSNIDQIKSVAKGFCNEPNASYHVIAIFRPVDLFEKFRPGYVPCVISADFKYRDGQLNGKFFFRSCDAFNLLPFDIFYCAGILEQLSEEIASRGFNEDFSIGGMTFWFSRIYVSRFDIGKRQSLVDRIDRFTNIERTVARRSLISSSKKKQKANITQLKT
jgi:thymidylate synthase